MKNKLDMVVQKRSYHLFCPICCNSILNNKFAINDFTIVQCQSCKLMFVKEKISQQELDCYYKQTAEGINADEDCVYGPQKNVGNLKYYYQNLRSLILKKISTGKILDIGCNEGYFLDLMKCFECYGVERSSIHGKIAKKKHGKNIFIGTFEDYKTSFLFDCITLQDVLDHMVDPLNVLKKCNKLLKPNGILIVKVHDMSCLYAKIMGRNFYAFIPPFHLFYFNRISLAMALKKSSFDIILSKHMGHMMFLSTIFYRLSKANQKSVFFKLYKLIEGTWLGNKKIYKNLNDIITVFAVKNEKRLEA